MEKHIKPNNRPSPGPIGNTQGLIVPKTEPNASGVGNSAPKITPSPKEKRWWQKTLEKYAEEVHEKLDYVGFIPVVGEAADVINAALYLTEKDKINAAISAVSVLPGGDVAKATRILKRIAKKRAMRKARKEATKRAAKPQGGNIIDGPRNKKARQLKESPR